VFVVPEMGEGGPGRCSGGNDNARPDRKMPEAVRIGGMCGPAAALREGL
jgi:hypothetical protein